MEKYLSVFWLLVIGYLLFDCNLKKYQHICKSLQDVAPAD